MRSEKNAMGFYKFGLLLLFVSVFSVAEASYGQSISIETVRVSAVVEENTPEIEVLAVQSLNLRDLEPGQQVVEVDPITSFRSGKLVASGLPGASFRISYLPTRELVNIEGTGLIFFEYTVSGAQMDEQDASEPFETESPVLEFNESGEYYIWIGGRINLSNAAPGTYQGEFTLEIEYI